MNATLKTLKSARALIADPAHWTKGELARDANDDPIRISSLNACKFCSLGALSRAVGVEDFWDTGAFVASRQALMATINGETVWVYNDNHTHAEVLKLFDDTIERLEKAQ